MSFPCEVLPQWIGWRVWVEVGDALLEAELTRPAGAAGLVLMPYAAGTLPWHRSVADVLHGEGFATLLFNEGIEKEGPGGLPRLKDQDAVAFIARRLVEVRQWSERRTEVRDLPCSLLGMDGAGTAALLVAAELGSSVETVISAAGRPDWVVHEMPRLKSPTLLLVGGLDSVGVAAHRGAYRSLMCPKALCVIPNASHELDEPGAFEEVGELAAAWIHQQQGGDV